MKTIFLALAALTFTFASGQKVVNGVKVPTSYSTKETNLTLNGAGIRTKYFFKLYVGALYVEKKTKNLSELLKDNSAIAMNLHITSSMIDTEKMHDAIKEGFGKSTPNPSPALKVKINKFLADVVKNKVKEGDLFSIYYEKGTETVKVSVNGKEIHAVKGVDFRNAIFGIWIGKNPVDKNLKVALAS